MTDLYGIIREWIRAWVIRRDVRRMVEKHGVKGIEDKLMELGCTKIVTRTSRIYTTPTQGKIEFTEDEIIINCTNIREALRMLEAIKQRLKDCKLEINQQKSKIVYCRRNQKRQPPFKVQYQKFDFLGHTFKPRVVQERGKLKVGFSPAISQKSQQRIGRELYKLKIHRMVHVPLSKIAQILKAKTHGWINYYGKFRLSEMRKIFRVLNFRLARMVRSKYRRFRNRHWYESYKFLKTISKDYPTMFVHWEHGFHP